MDAYVHTASPNGKSLILAFEAIVDGCVGMMPTLEEEDGTIINIFTGNIVKIELLPHKLNCTEKSDG